MSSVPARFVDLTTTAGIRFRHTNGESNRFFIAETMGSGCAFLDYNRDGRLDLFFVNSSRLPGFPAKGPFFPALYRSEGGGRFTDVTQAAGLTLDCYGMGVAVADYDNDGDPDLLLTSYGGSHLFRNEGGRFREVTRQAGVTKPKWGSSAAWFDYDRDGHLDLFICSYLKWTPETNLVCGAPGHRYACVPADYEGTASVLYRNKGNGTFTDVTKQAGVELPSGKALGVVIWDVDDDGWLDFAVANDAAPNWLFRNKRDGTFTEIGVEAGIAYGSQGRQRAGMGIDTADYDHSGREAILIGNLSGEGLALFRPAAAPPTLAKTGNAEAAMQFADEAEAAGLYHASLPFTTFGARFLDYDLDGFPDVLTANGHVNQQVGANEGAYRYEQRMQLFHNEADEAGQRRFRDVTEAAGAGLTAPRVGRGLAVGDVDADGDPDLLVSSNNGPAALLRNELFSRTDPIQNPKSKIQNRSHWLAVKLVGTKSNRDGIGARLRLTAGGQTQTGWLRSGGSYGSEDERLVRFGLGASTQVERLEVRWPSGTVERLTGVKADQVLVLREGQGQE